MLLLFDHFQIYLNFYGTEKFLPAKVCLSTRASGRETCVINSAAVVLFADRPCPVTPPAPLPPPPPSVWQPTHSSAPASGALPHTHGKGSSAAALSARLTVLIQGPQSARMPPACAAAGNGEGNTPNGLGLPSVGRACPVGGEQRLLLVSVGARRSQ